MNLEQMKELMDRPSREHSDLIAAAAISNRQTMLDLLTLAENDEKPYNWRSTWALKIIAAQNPEVLYPYQEKLCAMVRIDSDEKKVGNILKTLSFLPFHENCATITIDPCLDLILKPGITAYIKAYAMQYLLIIAKAIPELAPEFERVVDERLPSFEKNYLINQARNFQKTMRILIDSD
ncbi:MAG TPA: hypothetical protein DDX92_08205 [Flavobacteriales bacterium]|jgi:hypothetical protein|nr:hypothetical protein [Flavobacteriales bacterium]